MPLGSRSRPAAPPEEAILPHEEAASSLQPAPEAAPVSSSGRLARWLPRLQGLVRFAYRTAGVSALCAVVLWWALAGQAMLAVGGAAWLVGLGVLLVLLVPAGAAWLLGLTLHDVLTLPETIRKSASVAATASREALRSDASDEAEPTRGRLLGVLSALWAVRGFVLESRGAWAKAATAARVVRLAKLPFVLGLSGLFLLNGVVILAGLVAGAILLF